jgi:putative transcriptional regulator
MSDIHKGMILVAEPFMLDENFSRSVVLICEHTEEGTTGFVINRPIESRIHQLIEGFPKFNAEVYLGGPVSRDSLHFLHNVGNLIDDSVEVCPGVWWGGDFEKLRFLIESEVIHDYNIKFFIGYSGWSEGQLAEELTEPSWLIDEMDANYLFKIKPYVLWQTVLHNKGNIYSVIAQMPDPSLN